MSLLDLQSTAVADLTGAFSFTAEEAFNPEITLQSTENMRVLVVPVSVMNAKRLTRNNVWDELPTIQIAVVQRVQPNAGTPITEKAILTIAESIRDRYKTITRLTGTSVYTVMSVNFMPFYDYEELDDSAQIVSIIEVQFKELTI